LEDLHPSFFKLWHPGSWQSHPAKQQPVYPDKAELQHVLDQLCVLPPLVTSGEILSLQQKLADAVDGKAFLLQAGDCAENFSDCTPEVISNRLKVLLQMSLVLSRGLDKPIIHVGRFAGQYAKPRSSDTEIRNGLTLPSYRGDSINDIEFTPAARRSDPQRLLAAHKYSAMTLNFVRALCDGGFTEIDHAEQWEPAWHEVTSFMPEEYQNKLSQAQSLLLNVHKRAFRHEQHEDSIHFFTSHEALLLHYEQALTREVPHRSGWFNLSTHFPWIGMRTSDINGAHVEYGRGIENPIGLKLGTEMSADSLIRLIELLNPTNKKGRVTLIHRMGARNIATTLPPLIKKVKSAGLSVLWCCDPMHGNTETLSNGIKTRRFEAICSETRQAFEIHQELGTCLGGVHLELTGENVTECTGGARDLTEKDLVRAYKSTVDPRLNYEQSLELAALIAQKAGVSSFVDARRSTRPPM